MKKVYISPNCEVIEMEVETQILSGSVLEVNPGLADDGFDLESNRHHGEWGNLWEKW